MINKNTEPVTIEQIKKELDKKFEDYKNGILPVQATEEERLNLLEEIRKAIEEDRSLKE